MQASFEGFLGLFLKETCDFIFLRTDSTDAMSPSQDEINTSNSYLASGVRLFNHKGYSLTHY